MKHRARRRIARRRRPEPVVRWRLDQYRRIVKWTREKMGEMIESMQSVINAQLFGE